MNAIVKSQSKEANVVRFSRNIEPADLATDIKEHAQLIRAYRCTAADQKKVEEASEKIKSLAYKKLLADNKLAELEFRKLPAKTKARLALWDALQKQQGAKRDVYQLFNREVSYLQRLLRAIRDKIDAIETRILMVQPKASSEIALLLTFLATLLREGRPVAKDYLADVLEDFTNTFQQEEAPHGVEIGMVAAANTQHPRALGYI